MAEMLCITAPSFVDPSGYELSTLPRPAIIDPTDVVIRVHAASVNPVDVKLASGVFKRALPEQFPLKIGYDCAGVVTEVGSEVARLKVGNEVYTRLPEASKGIGSWGEYVKCPVDHVALKPESLSFGDAASLPLAALTALQALRKYDGSLAGKTVLIPAGLGGSGSFACQLAKNVFGAGKVITTVSTSKVDKIDDYLGKGVVDQVIDYTKSDPIKVIPPSSVDFMLDTVNQAMEYLSLMVPSTGTIISISTTPSGFQLQTSSFFKRPGNPQMPFFARMFLDGTDYIRKTRAWRWGVKYEYMFLQSNAEDLDLLTKYINENKLRPAVGSRTPLKDIEAVRKVCQQVYQGKGGIGKATIEVIPDR